MSFLCTSVFGIWNNTHIPGGLGNSQGATATSTASLNQIKLWQGFSASNLDRYRGAGGPVCVGKGAFEQQSTCGHSLCASTNTFDVDSSSSLLNNDGY